MPPPHQHLHPKAATLLAITTVLLVGMAAARLWMWLTFGIAGLLIIAGFDLFQILQKLGWLLHGTYEKRLQQAAAPTPLQTRLRQAAARALNAVPANHRNNLRTINAVALQNPKALKLAPEPDGNIAAVVDDFHPGITLVISARTIELLTDTQLTAVVAHELGHVAAGGMKRRAAAHLLGQLTNLAINYGLLLVLTGPHTPFWTGLATYLTALLGVTAAQQLLTRRHARRKAHAREFEADTFAAQLGYARQLGEALQILHHDETARLKPHQRPTLAHASATHPSVAARLHNLGLTPQPNR